MYFYFSVETRTGRTGCNVIGPTDIGRSGDQLYGREYGLAVRKNGKKSTSRESGKEKKKYDHRNEEKDTGPLPPSRITHTHTTDGCSGRRAHRRTDRWAGGAPTLCADCRVRATVGVDQSAFGRRSCAACSTVTRAEPVRARVLCTPFSNTTLLIFLFYLSFSISRKRAHPNFVRPKIIFHFF